MATKLEFYDFLIKHTWSFNLNLSGYDNSLKRAKQHAIEQNNPYIYEGKKRNLTKQTLSRKLIKYEKGDILDKELYGIYDTSQPPLSKIELTDNTVEFIMELLNRYYNDINGYYRYRSHLGSNWFHSNYGRDNMRYGRNNSEKNFWHNFLNHGNNTLNIFSQHEDSIYDLYKNTLNLFENMNEMLTGFIYDCYKQKHIKFIACGDQAILSDFNGKGTSIPVVKTKVYDPTELHIPFGYENGVKEYGCLGGLILGHKDTLTSVLGSPNAEHYYSVGGIENISLINECQSNGFIKLFEHINKSKLLFFSYFHHNLDFINISIENARKLHGMHNGTLYEMDKLFLIYNLITELLFITLKYTIAYCPEIYKKTQQEASKQLKEVTYMSGEDINQNKPSVISTHQTETEQMEKEDQMSKRESTLENYRRNSQGGKRTYKKKKLKNKRKQRKTHRKSNKHCIHKKLCK